MLSADTRPADERGVTGLTLILGGARSGKSRLAETLVAETGLRRVYIATASTGGGDAEMAARIAHHRARRGPGWTTVEEPLDLPGALERVARPGRAVLVDCLTLWLANLLWAGRDPAAATGGLLGCLRGIECPVVLVSNEVGLDIVPGHPLARRFRDEAGRLHQALAEAAGRVILTTAGLPLLVKPSCTKPLPLGLPP